MRSAIASLLLIVALAPARAQDPAANGPNLVRTETLSITVGGKKTSVEVHLPAGPSFARPVVFVVPGWAAGPGNFESLADHFASLGFAAALYKEPDNWSNDTAKWSGHIHDAIDALTAAGGDPRSSVFGELDMSKLSLLGHSFGGAAVVVEAASDPRVKSVVAFAPVNQAHRDLLLQSASKLDVPLLVVAGSGDWLATNKTYTQPIYDQATNAPDREYIEIKGGGHNLYQDGEKGSKDHAIALSYATAWLERFLQGKADAGGYTDGTHGEADRNAGLLSQAKHAAKLVVETAGLTSRLP